MKQIDIETVIAILKGLQTKTLSASLHRKGWNTALYAAIEAILRIQNNSP